MFLQYTYLTCSQFCFLSLLTFMCIYDACVDLSTGGKGPAVVVDLSSFVPEEFIMSLICTERKGAPTSYTMLIGTYIDKLNPVS